MRLAVVAALVAVGLVPSTNGTSARHTCPLAARARTASAVGTEGCSGVRPGAYFRTPHTGCSFNFLFRGADGYRYIGSAGHCLLAPGETTKRTWRLGFGPLIRSDSGAVVGRAAYAVVGGEHDFSLIRLNRDVKASPQMCHFGGPTAIDDTYTEGPALLEHYGQGRTVSDVTPGRTAVTTDTRGADTVTAFGIGNFGDSGSGIMRDGRALGVIVALVIGEPRGNMLITRLLPQLEEAERALRTKLTLQTAPRL